ncbi:MAG TPA: hypothetical protein PLI27_06625 [Ignavibacteriales bacterium]|nr:hypothetical protein [Ignavibacteriales bacterium]HRT98317.1 hypothetical protein [Ignavibacteriales bacterium]
MAAKSKIISVLVLFVVLFVGCGKGDKEKELEEKIAKLEAEKMGLEQYVAEVTNTINEIQDQVDKITADAKLIRKDYNIENGNLNNTQKEEIKQKLELINQQFAENKKKFEMLKKQMAKQKVKVASLEKMIANLEKSIKEKEEYIQELEELVRNLNIQVTTLKETVSGLQSEVSSKEKEIQKQKSELEEKSTELSKGYVIIGSEDELRQKKIIKAEGKVLGMGGTVTVDPDMNLNDLTEININNKKVFILGENVKKYKILPARNSATYSIEKNGNETKLVVKDVDNFWKTKYLIIITED